MGRKLEVGGVLSEVFAIYRENAGVLIPVAFWLFLAVAIVQGIAGGSLFLTLLGAILSLVASIIYEGMVVSLVRDVQDGRRDLSVGQLFQSVAPVLGSLAGASILYALGVGVGFVLLIVPGLFLLTIWAVIAPAIVIENRGAIEAFGRSRELVKGFGWPVFGVVICAALIVAVVSIILLSIAAAIADGPILRIVLGVLASTVTAPVTALVAGVLYYRLLQLKGDPGTIAASAADEDYTPPPPPPPEPPSGPVAPA
jgi:MFS family permease